MSLGWLTESAVLPKKAKPIQVDSSSLLSIQSTISEETDKLSNEPKAPCAKSLRKILGKRPPPKEELPAGEPGPDRTEVLTTKSRLYEELRRAQSGNTSEKYLVDFDARSDSSSDEPRKRPRMSYEESDRGGVRQSYENLLTKEEKL